MPLYIAKKATSKTDRLNLHGAPEEIRTPGLQVRSLLLYPAELRARREKLCIENSSRSQAFSKRIFQKRVLHKECYNGILQLRSSLCNTVQKVRQSGL